MCRVVRNLDYQIKVDMDFDRVIFASNLKYHAKYKRHWKKKTCVLFGLWLLLFCHHKLKLVLLPGIIGNDQTGVLVV